MPHPAADHLVAQLSQIEDEVVVLGHRAEGRLGEAPAAVEVLGRPLAARRHAQLRRRRQGVAFGVALGQFREHERRDELVRIEVAERAERLLEQRVLVVGAHLPRGEVRVLVERQKVPQHRPPPAGEVVDERFEHARDAGEVAAERVGVVGLEPRVRDHDDAEAVVPLPLQLQVVEADERFGRRVLPVGDLAAARGERDEPVRVDERDRPRLERRLELGPAVLLPVLLGVLPRALAHPLDEVLAHVGQRRRLEVDVVVAQLLEHGPEVLQRVRLLLVVHVRPLAGGDGGVGQLLLEREVEVGGPLPRPEERVDRRLEHGLQRLGSAELLGGVGLGGGHRGELEIALVHEAWWKLCCAGEAGSRNRRSAIS